jgi:AmmeMemoRadiSam system protein A
MPLDEATRQRLHALAREAIRHGLSHHGPPALDLTALPAELRKPGACFVTLQTHGRLRGCIGSLDPRRPLAEDVNANAYAAAFADPRFPPLREEELAALEVHISIIGPPTPLACENEAHLLGLLRPGVDGLILRENETRATFLPSVWAELPRPRDFVRHLKQKAGLPPDYWSPSLRFARYETESI